VKLLSLEGEGRLRTGCLGECLDARDREWSAEGGGTGGENCFPLRNIAVLKLQVATSFIVFFASFNDCYLLIKRTYPAYEPS
jgi:hypothetical protein